MGVTDWGEINQPLGAPALGGAGGWADSVAQALNNSDETVDARLATLEAAMEALIDGRVDKSGDTMTGPLVLPGDPTADLHAATKGYVDDIEETQLPLNAGWSGTMYVVRYGKVCTLYFNVQKSSAPAAWETIGGPIPAELKPSNYGVAPASASNGSGPYHVAFSTNVQMAGNYGWTMPAADQAITGIASWIYDREGLT